MNNIEDIIKEKGVYFGKIQGDSMLPLIREDKDKVIITRPQKFPLNKYDVPVYKKDGHLTMHRIIKVTAKGYIICGDNRVNLERDITDDLIIGVLAGIRRENEYIDCKSLKYKIYARYIIFTYPIRKFIRHFKKDNSIT